MTKEPHPLEIPSFLRISSEERKKAWLENPPHRRNRMEETDAELRKLTDEYNSLGGVLLDLGGTFRPRSAFRHPTEAAEHIEQMKSSIKARRDGLAAMKNQPNDPPGLVKENPKMQTQTNSAKPKKVAVKKAAPKKATKAAPKKAKSATGRYDADAKITIIAKENPRREGSKKHKDFETARKAHTVGDYAKAGGDIASLRKCVAKGWIKLS